MHTINLLLTERHRQIFVIAPQMTAHIV